MSVKDTQAMYMVQHTLTVLQPVEQIRLSFLVSTIGTFLIVVVAVIAIWFSEPLDQSDQPLKRPHSLVAWMVQASQEHFGETEVDVSCSPTTFALQHKDLCLTTFTKPDGQGYFVAIQ
jgi:hypothetical protein